MSRGALTRSPIIAPKGTALPPGFAGAHAEEVAESRIGLQTGMPGAQNVTRTFRVYTDSPGDNPVTTIEALPSNLGGLQTGSRFPMTGGWGDGTYKLFNWTILDHWIGTNVWILLATYLPSYIGFGPSPLWTFRVKSSLETEKVFTDLDGKGIGSPKYTTSGSLASPNKFTTRNLDQSPMTATLWLAGGGSDPYDKNLPRFQVGADRPRRTSTVVLTKVISSLTPYNDAMTFALTNAKAVNNDAVFILTTAGIRTLVDSDARKGTILFQDFDLEPIVNESGGGEPSYRVTITLKHDPGYSIGETWYPPFQEHRPHLHKWDDGTESPVFREGTTEQINESWKMIDSTNLGTLIGGFN